MMVGSLYESRSVGTLVWSNVLAIDNVKVTAVFDITTPIADVCDEYTSFILPSLSATISKDVDVVARPIFSFDLTIHLTPLSSFDAEIVAPDVSTNALKSS